MNHDPALTNGKPGASTRPSHRAEPLPYFCADQSAAVYRSIHSVKARRDEDGVYRAKRQLASEIHDYLRGQTIARIAIEGLSPALATCAAADRVAATTPLSPADGLDGLTDHLRQLTQLRRGKPSPVLTALSDISREAADAQFRDFEPQLAAAVAHAPLVATEWLTATLKHLDDLSYPDSTGRALARLANIVTHLRSLRHDPEALPPHKRAAIEQRLVHAGREAAVNALAEITIARTTDAYRTNVIALRKKLQAWQTQAASCQQNLLALRQLLDEEATRHQHRLAQESRAGLIILTGPSEERVREALVKELSCDSDDLAAALFTAWMARLTERIAHRFGGEIAGQPGEVLARTDRADCLSLFHDVVDRHLRQISIYATLRAEGIEGFADRLYANAEPLVQLSRQSVELGLEFTSAAVLVAPEPQGTQDAETLATLKNTLSERGSVHLRVSALDTQEIRLTRTLAGFPAAVQSINRALMWGYAKSREHHHFPHLVGLLPDSPDGRASEASVALIAAHPSTPGGHHGN